ncbi:MAG: 3-ketoacyl-ACP reductase [Rhodospirillum sp.]|nr:3-ketoacyl-ACP reductase [Rhodospirillum sp.]MCF8489443.1 3-ketoacyl-ACP reductase [Rhodospirillum sp.]MCF8500957.1 3-ketoacyl-ACP reductase [Rhodospirillum sp.]
MRGAAIVTGGRRGIGRAISIALASRGFDVAVVDIVEDDEAEKTIAGIRKHGRNAAFYRSDISRISTHDDLLERIESAQGPLGCLVNNAGIQVSVRGDLLRVTEESFDRLIAVNLKGTFFLSIAAARRMLAAAAPARERSIITITSANAALVSPEKGPYGISKAGLSMASQQLAVRLAPEGVRVHEIRPGLIATDMTKDVRDSYGEAISSGRVCPMRRWGEPEDIARGVATLASGDMPFSTGDIYNIGGGMQIPRL